MVEMSPFVQIHDGRRFLHCRLFGAGCEGHNSALSGA